jgi:Spy/CpxP family protein refolding chaperone
MQSVGVRAAILALGMMAVGTVPMLAQDNPGPPPGGRGQMQERQLEMMTKALDLTPDQVTQVKAINADSRQQMEALRADTSTPQEDKRDKMMAIRKSSQEKIRAILTDDQKAKFDAMQARMRERRQQGGDAPPAPPPQ